MTTKPQGNSRVVEACKEHHQKVKGTFLANMFTDPQVPMAVLGALLVTSGGVMLIPLISCFAGAVVEAGFVFGSRALADPCAGPASSAISKKLRRFVVLEWSPAREGRLSTATVILLLLFRDAPSQMPLIVARQSTSWNMKIKEDGGFAPRCWEALFVRRNFIVQYRQSC